MSAEPFNVAEYLRLAVRHPLRWFIPAALTMALAAAYAFLKSDSWEASQTLMVRAEANGNLDGPGRFRSLTEMKTLEETLVEMVKNRDTLRAALEAVGPPAEQPPIAAWPTPRDVDDLSDAVKIAPPKGAEFGSTEVFYLRVKAKEPDRAIALADAVAKQLLARFARLREDRARGVVLELQQAAAAAQSDLATSVTALGKFEAGVGGDLAELRNLETQSAGQGELHKITGELESEIRQIERTKRDHEELLTLLKTAEADPAAILATPNRLLESQPALRRLKDGLVDAQLRTSQLLGGMSREHPLVRGAMEAEAEIRSRLHDEVATAVRGVESELRTAADLLGSRQRRLAEVRTRLDKLAGSRAEYSVLYADTQNRTRQLEAAQKQLAEAKAVQAGAVAAGLVSCVGTPDPGSKPLGPGKTTLLALGLVGGLLVGLGWLVLTAPLPPSLRSVIESPATDVRSVDELTADHARAEIPISANPHLEPVAAGGTR